MDQKIDLITAVYTSSAIAGSNNTDNENKTGSVEKTAVAEENDANVVLSAKSETTNTSSTSGSSKLNKKISELKTKYYVASGKGDKYSTNNPQLVSFNQAMKDGLIEALTKDGFSTSDIIEIISQVFPDIGIRAGANGSYSLPHGHGTDAKEIYNSFKEKISSTNGSSEKTEKLKSEIAEIQIQINYNISKLEQLEGLIESLKAEIEKEIEEALNESEELTETQKKDAQKVVSEELNKYTASKGKMSYEEFKFSLSSRLDALDSSGSSKLASITRKIIQAQNKMPVLNNYLSAMDSYINLNKTLSTKLTQKNTELVEAQKEAAAQSEAKRCDPIGFFSDGSRYDFFVDKDGNNDLSNENEFLGAGSGWKEMAALDTDKDGLVSGKELQEAGIKLVVTNADGTQTIKNAADVFGENDYVDLNSYKEKGQNIGNGNTLLGIFTLNKGGTNIKDGYNTLDSLDWLDQNYNFSDKDAGINRFAQNQTVAATQTSKSYSDDLNVYRKDYTELENKLDTAISKLGYNREDLYSVSLILEKEGVTEAEDLNKKFEQLKLKEKDS